MVKKETLDKIQNILLYVGTIGAVIMSLAYVLTILILIRGFEAHSILQTSIFAVVSAAVGVVIMMFLKVQGQSWAASLPENQEIMKQYNGMTIKDKKRHSMAWFWVTSTTKDIFGKVLSIVASSIGVIYLVIVGSNDWTLLLSGFVHLAMFICFGMLGCSKAYNYYNNEHIAYIKEKIRENSEKNKEITDDNSEQQGA